MKIKQKLIIIFLSITLIPLFVASVFSASNARSAMKELIGANFSNLAEEKASAIEFIFRERISEVRNLASLPFIIDAVKQANSSYGIKSQNEINAGIKHIDDAWIADKNNSDVAAGILKNPISQFLRQYQERDVKYGEIFLTDVNGATVAMTKTLRETTAGSAPLGSIGNPSGAAKSKDELLGRL